LFKWPCNCLLEWRCFLLFSVVTTLRFWVLFLVGFKLLISAYDQYNISPLNVILKTCIWFLPFLCVLCWSIFIILCFVDQLSFFTLSPVSHYVFSQSFDLRLLTNNHFCIFTLFCTIGIIQNDLIPCSLAKACWWSNVWWIVRYKSLNKIK
jgi:hypothetical protein